jgi:hypothetical protein
MVPRIETARGLSSVVREVMRPSKRPEGNGRQERSESRVTLISGQNFGFDIKTREDVEIARRLMEFMAMRQGSRTRKCKKHALHITLWWHPDDRPTREQMEEAGRDALKALGMEEARAIFAARAGTKMMQIHIVASRINPETRRTFPAWRDRIKIQEWARDYELKSGIVRCPRRQAVPARHHEKILETLTTAEAA